MTQCTNCGGLMTPGETYCDHCGHLASTSISQAQPEIVSVVTPVSSVPPVPSSFGFQQSVTVPSATSNFSSGLNENISQALQNPYSGIIKLFGESAERFQSTFKVDEEIILWIEIKPSSANGIPILKEIMNFFDDYISWIAIVFSLRKKSAICVTNKRILIFERNMMFWVLEMNAIVTDLIPNQMSEIRVERRRFLFFWKRQYVYLDGRKFQIKNVPEHLLSTIIEKISNILI